jgi:phospholipid-translocating ATPase
LRSGKPIDDLNAEFVVPTPNDLIYKFEGTAHLIDHDVIKTRIPMDYDNTIWSGCIVAKGEVIGMVVYNGSESKIMMNSSEGEIKRSLVTHELNDYSKILFLIMLTLSLVILYLKGNSRNFGVQVFRYVLLLSTIIPISMKVNHDLSRLYYSSRINSDKDILGCQARNSGVCEDLGRIQYFLTDKTGTLTKNVMVMRKVFINGMGLIDEKEFKNQASKFKHKHNEHLRLFTSCMMVCHSVSPCITEQGKRVLESASPDEISFIEMMERDGLYLIDKTDKQVQYTDEYGVKQVYNILVTFPFTSERKRMGVICYKEGDEQLTYFLKGADSIMQLKIKKKDEDTMMSHVEELSSEGLRTLALAASKIDKSTYDRWRVDYDSACASLKRRNERVEACLQQLERDMDFVGITAVEDLLQNNVKQSIVYLRDAGIKVWMLTGDKMETARCISLSTGLLSRADEVWLIDRITDGQELREKFNHFMRSYVRHRVDNS